MKHERKQLTLPTDSAEGVPSKSVIMSNWCTTFFPGKRGFPVSISANIQPMLQISMAGVYCHNIKIITKKRKYYTLIIMVQYTYISEIQVWRLSIVKLYFILLETLLTNANSINRSIQFGMGFCNCIPFVPDLYIEYITLEKKDPHSSGARYHLVAT